MLLTRLYYLLKPFIPGRLRLASRRIHARRILKTCGDRWPIMDSAARPPAGWPGWPSGRKFAFVLTHDVETQRGLDRVKPLAELEMRLGFRSSFNFIPEGPYQVPAELLDWLTERGFEVGVHDLHHDGKLYSSRAAFRSKAVRINRHLRDWNAVGFRSGFMLRNLDWLGDLNILYDSSTFDTDPFEPQPDGAGTIFPFWVPGLVTDRQSPATDHSAGYVELPYTLPQDSSLFLILGENTDEIWRTKVDWVAARGGMAMVIVHPDYIRFEGEPPSPDTFPVELYAGFLQHARSKHGESSWLALPRDVAAFTARHKPRLPTKPRRVGMIAYSNYQTDARVTRYAEALAARGNRVDVFALRRSSESPTHEKVGGVHLVCRQLRIGKKEQSQLDFLLPLLRFLFSSMVWITREHALRPFDVIHVHNMPDFLVFAAWYPKLTGIRVILDIHDIVPELYSSKFGEQHGSATVAMLKWVERVSARFSDWVIISNHLWSEKFASRTGANGKCSVFINNVDSNVFHPRPRTRSDDRLIVIFPGGLQWHQGLDIALRAFQTVSREFSRAELHIYGEGIMKPSLVALAGELGFNGNVRFFEPLPVNEIAQRMADADLGVVPKRADSFGNEAYSTKIMEFMSLGVPVVISSTKVDRYYFNDSVVRFFESGNADALAREMIDLLHNRELRSQMAARGSAYAAANCWESRKADYLALVDSLCPAGPAARESHAQETAV